MLMLPPSGDATDTGAKEKLIYGILGTFGHQGLCSAK